MGNALGLTPTTPAGTATARRLRSARFGIGLAGVFVSTVFVALALLAAGAQALPGWDATVVASSSMSPALRRGDVVAYQHASPSDVGVGTVVVFDDNGVSMVHRVVQVAEDGSLTTRGDASADNDTTPVTADNLAGAGVLLVPWVGLPRMWWIEHDRVKVLLTCLATLFALASSRWASTSANDPWSNGAHASPAGSWLGRPAPVTSPTLLPAAHRSVILGRARSCG